MKTVAERVAERQSAFRAVQEHLQGCPKCSLAKRPTTRPNGCHKGETLLGKWWSLLYAKPSGQS